MQIFKESTKRSVIKAVTFRLLIIITNGIIVYLVTHRFNATLSIVALSSVTSTLIYFLHERVWNRVLWGKKSDIIKG